VIKETLVAEEKKDKTGFKIKGVLGPRLIDYGILSESETESDEDMQQEVGARGAKRSLAYEIEMERMRAELVKQMQLDENSIERQKDYIRSSSSLLPTEEYGGNSYQPSPNKSERTFRMESGQVHLEAIMEES